MRDLFEKVVECDVGKSECGEVRDLIHQLICSKGGEDYKDAKQEVYSKVNAQFHNCF